MYEYINKTTPHLEIATLVVYDMTKQYYSENNLISPVTETCTIKIQEMPPALVCSLIIEYLCDEAILEKETINFNNLPDLLIGCCKTLERRHSMARVQRPFHSVKRFLNF
ncbi:hypothetical protein J6590_106764 [Homalodisca vitripennis]|nr:hypothetical protein J6590_106764 [Homalodisca vitripennis]